MFSIGENPFISPVPLVVGLAKEGSILGSEGRVSSDAGGLGVEGVASELIEYELVCTGEVLSDEADNFPWVVFPVIVAKAILDLFLPAGEVAARLAAPRVLGPGPDSIPSPRGSRSTATNRLLRRVERDGPDAGARDVLTFVSPRTGSFPTSSC